MRGLYLYIGVNSPKIRQELSTTSSGPCPAPPSTPPPIRRASPATGLHAADSKTAAAIEFLLLGCPVLGAILLVSAAECANFGTVLHLARTLVTTGEARTVLLATTDACTNPNNACSAKSTPSSATVPHLAS
ncbi:hypothetical protein FHY52_12335 [Nocardia nova]|nr:hypothetical protein [Nocardia nova]MDN2497466.1 hypothetical protein [Nocardia nova]